LKEFLDHMSDLNKNNSQRIVWLLALLFGLPLVLILAKLPGLPTAEFLTQHDTLAHLPEQLQTKVAHILFVPLGAMLIVFFRLTLGIRVLGPFRSVLLAVAFQVTGIVLGLIFLMATVAIVVAIRPPIKTIKLPYFGRITVMLSAVAALMVVGVLASDWLQLDALRSIAYFPIVVLCLVADAFARTANKEGVPSALWRGGMTALIAVLLTWLAGISQVRQLLLDYPELLIAQIGGIIVISKFMAFRWLKFLNPHDGEDEEDMLENDEDERTRVLPVPVLSNSANGVGSLFRSTAAKPESSVSEKDSRPLSASIN
jgi:hypothetical protein